MLGENSGLRPKLFQPHYCLVCNQSQSVAVFKSSLAHQEGHETTIRCSQSADILQLIGVKLANNSDNEAMVQLIGKNICQADCFACQQATCAIAQVGRLISLQSV